MLIIAFLPLELIVLIVTVIVFRDQKKKEELLEELYSQYGEKMTLPIKERYHTFVSDIDSNSYFFQVIYTDKNGNQTLCSVSRGNKEAKKYMAGNSVDIYCLKPIVEEYSSMGRYFGQGSDTPERLRRGLLIFSFPLMIVAEDRPFKERGKKHRISMIAFYLSIIIFNVALYFLYNHFGWAENTGYVYAVNAFTIILCAALVVMPVINAKKL